jgi:sugar phosphate isomerase/epimerase
MNGLDLAGGIHYLGLRMKAPIQTDSSIPFSHPTRRQFLGAVATATAGLTFASALGVRADEPAKRKMTINLVCGAIGVSADQRQAIELAVKYGFESVEAYSGFLAGLSSAELDDLKGFMKSKPVVFGAAGLSVEFRQDEAKLKEGLAGLPKIAKGLQNAGVDRVCTWLMPCDGKLTYLQNFQQHSKRLREIAIILKDHGIRFGLEYVGPKTSWSSRVYPFIHTMPEMKELIADINTGNVGFLLDSWHWWHAGDTVSDLLTLRSTDVVAVDLNDAPTGIPKDQQSDGKRELPCATGVIDVGAFLNALNQIGYDGPVRAEPFNQALNNLDNDEACAATAAAMKKAFALIK